MYIKLKKLTKNKIKENYDWIDPYEKKELVGWYDEVDQVESLPSGTRYGKISPILIIVHGRIYREVADGYKKGDLAYIPDHVFHQMF